MVCPLNSDQQSMQLRRQALILIVLFLTPPLFGAGQSFPGTRFSGYMINYAGDEKESFAEAETGQGLEVTTQKQGVWVAPYAKVRLVTINGNQDFNDGGTDVDTNFTYYQGAMEVGSYFFPLGREKSSFNLFFGIGAGLSYNYINLSSDSSLTTIPGKDQSLSFGYSAHVGGEWILSDQGHKWSLIGEFSYHAETTKILKVSQFDLGGFVISVGLGF